MANYTYAISGETVTKSFVAAPYPFKPSGPAKVVQTSGQIWPPGR